MKLNWAQPGSGRTRGRRSAFWRRRLPLHPRPPVRTGRSQTPRQSPPASHMLTKLFLEWASLLLDSLPGLVQLLLGKRAFHGRIKPTAAAKSPWASRSTYSWPAEMTPPDGGGRSCCGVGLSVHDPGPASIRYPGHHLRGGRGRVLVAMPTSTRLTGVPFRGLGRPPAEGLSNSTSTIRLAK